jgi:hypothetical protein
MVCAFDARGGKEAKGVAGRVGERGSGVVRGGITNTHHGAEVTMMTTGVNDLSDMTASSRARPVVRKRIDVIIAGPRMGIELCLKDKSNVFVRNISTSCSPPEIISNIRRNDVLTKVDGREIGDLLGFDIRDEKSFRALTDYIRNANRPLVLTFERCCHVANASPPCSPHDDDDDAMTPVATQRPTLASPPHRPTAPSSGGGDWDDDEDGAYDVVEEALSAMMMEGCRRSRRTKADGENLVGDVECAKSSSTREVIVLNDDDDDDVGEDAKSYDYAACDVAEEAPFAAMMEGCRHSRRMKADGENLVSDVEFAKSPTTREVIDLDDDDDVDEDAKFPPATMGRWRSSVIRYLSRHELQVAVDAFVNMQGGYEAIENGELIRYGNNNTMRSASVADYCGVGGIHQTGAQYGRYSIVGLWRVFDVLQGEAELDVPEGKVLKEMMKYTTPEARHNRLDGLSCAKINAFVDIGHGLGIQVLQAGWSLGVQARGVEIMEDRHRASELIRQGVLESLRDDPPDDGAVELRWRNFRYAVETATRDEELRTYLLLKDRSMTVQKGLVIFVNNAWEVFSARSNLSAKDVDLDALLARLFASMQIGGRMVTLYDVSCHLTSTEWFRRDIFESGTNAVCWGNQNKSVIVFVLTKLSDHWSCRYDNCDHKKLHNRPATNDVVDVNGEQIECCAFCSKKAKRSPRLRIPVVGAGQPPAATTLERSNICRKRKVSSNT